MNILRAAVISSLLFVASSVAAERSFPPWDGKETVADYAKRANLAPTLTLDLGGGVTWEGVLIPAGTFVMGSPPGEAKTAEQSANEKQHKVTLTKPFYLGKFELTQAQYEKVMGDNPSPNKGDDLPVHNVSWQNARDFVDASEAPRVSLIPVFVMNAVVEHWSIHRFDSQGLFSAGRRSGCLARFLLEFV